MLSGCTHADVAIGEAALSGSLGRKGGDGSEEVGGNLHLGGW